jgi:hypothetical protein
MAAAAKPIDPAEPPPPPVSPAVKRTCGIPSICAMRLVSMNAPPYSANPSTSSALSPASSSAARIALIARSFVVCGSDRARR